MGDKPTTQNAQALGSHPLFFLLTGPVQRVHAFTPVNTKKTLNTHGVGIESYLCKSERFSRAPAVPRAFLKAGAPWVPSAVVFLPQAHERERETQHAQRTLCVACPLSPTGHNHGRRIHKAGRTYSLSLILSFSHTSTPSPNNTKTKTKNQRCLSAC